MAEMTLHTVETAPESTKKTLAEIEKNYGFLPNLFGYLAESPTALNAYLDINDQLMKHSSLSPAQVQLTLLAISAENHCEFCVAAHSWGTKMANANSQSVEQLRAGEDVTDAKDAALVNFARAVVRERGFVDPSVTDAFFAAGYTAANLYDVLVCNMLKALSNYTNHITHTEINPELQSFAR